MTRGKIILINNEKNKLKLTGTCEFNGDMYFSEGNWRGHGENIVINLKDIETIKDFKRYIKYFDKAYFNYQSKCKDYFHFWTLNNNEDDIFKNEIINLCDNYFEFWFSDYLYFKNVSEKDIKIIYNNNNNEVKDIIIKNNEIKVFYFGELYNYKKDLIEIINKMEV